jgi:hypothetical protein
MIRLVVVLLSAVIALGRFTVPGHGLTGWPGTYEALAHIALGALIAIAYFCKVDRAMTIMFIAVVTLLECAMFALQRVW